MKKIIFTFYASAVFSCFLGKAQVTLSNAGVNPANPITSPANLSQLEVRGRLLTQNSFAGAGVPTAGLETGSFGANARWNSMGSLNAGSQFLNGFRTQTDGRALTMGHRVSGGNVSNPFIEWIGNSSLSPRVDPGNLEFKYALSPTSGVNSATNLFTLSPAKSTPFATPSFAFADVGAFIGQKENGDFGRFTSNDIWSATGLVTVPSGDIFYGNRHQYRGTTLSSGLFTPASSPNAVKAFIDFGSDLLSGSPSVNLQFRTFIDPVQPSTVENIMVLSQKFKSLTLTRQDIGSTLFATAGLGNLGVFDGNTAQPAIAISGFIDKAAAYGTGDGADDLGNPFNGYAAVVGDVEQNFNSNLSIGVLGIANQSNPNSWAGYAIGNCAYTGSLIFVSDPKYKTKVNDEASMLTKLMKLTPKNYFFDREKFKNMAFSDKLQHGFLSTDVEAVFPELVHQSFAPSLNTDPKVKGKPEIYKGLNYMGFIPVLTKAIQEQQQMIELQQAQIDALTKQITNSQTFVINDNAISKTAQTELDSKAFTLSQNVPNPFSVATTITYTIPSTTKQAQLAIFDLNGRMLQQYNLSQGKDKQLTIQASTLQPGMYLYTLLADGVEVITKKMILTR